MNVTSQMRRIVSTASRRHPRPQPSALCSRRPAAATFDIHPGSARSFSSPTDDDGAPDDAATVVQGPSLLANTGVHRPSPSLFHLPGLRSLPFWTAPASSPSGGDGRHRVAYGDPAVSRVVRAVEDAFEDIRDEYLSAVVGNGTAIDPASDDRVAPPLEPDYDVNQRGGEHASDALHSGSWDWHSYVLNGQRRERFAERCPKTAAVVDGLAEEGLLFETPFAFCFYSTLAGKSRINAHVGPMNLRLRLHLPLLVPEEGNRRPDGVERPACGLRVGDQVREWETGKALVLDDAYEHEVWNDASEPRVLLLLDMWHPDVQPEEKERIRNMFEYAQGKGWIGKEGPTE